MFLSKIGFCLNSYILLLVINWNHWLNRQEFRDFDETSFGGYQKKEEAGSWLTMNLADMSLFSMIWFATLRNHSLQFTMSLDSLHRVWCREGEAALAECDNGHFVVSGWSRMAEFITLFLSHVIFCGIK